MISLFLYFSRNKSLLPGCIGGLRLCQIAICSKPRCRVPAADPRFTDSTLGNRKFRNITEDTIQTLLMGANHLLDFSLSMEKTIIELRQSALQTYNIALGGQACGKLLDLLENIFGYPEIWASKDFEAALWPYSLLDPEHEPK